MRRRACTKEKADAYDALIERGGCGRGARTRGARMAAGGRSGARRRRGYRAATLAHRLCARVSLALGRSRGAYVGDRAPASVAGRRAVHHPSRGCALATVAGRERRCRDGRMGVRPFSSMDAGGLARGRGRGAVGDAPCGASRRCAHGDRDARHRPRDTARPSRHGRILRVSGAGARAFAPLGAHRLRVPRRRDRGAHLWRILGT